MWFNGVLGRIPPRPLMSPPKKQEITQGMQISMPAGTESIQNFAKFRQLPTVAGASQSSAYWRRILLQEIYQKLLKSRYSYGLKSSLEFSSSHRTRIQHICWFKVPTQLGIKIQTTFRQQLSNSNITKAPSVIWSQCFKLSRDFKLVDMLKPGLDANLKIRASF